MKTLSIELFQELQDKITELEIRYDQAIQAEAELMSGKKKIEFDLLTADALLQYRLNIVKQIHNLNQILNKN